MLNCKRCHSKLIEKHIGISNDGFTIQEYECTLCDSFFITSLNKKTKEYHQTGMIQNAQDR